MSWHDSYNLRQAEDIIPKLEGEVTMKKEMGKQIHPNAYIHNTDP